MNEESLRSLIVEITLVKFTAQDWVEERTHSARRLSFGRPNLIDRLVGKMLPAIRRRIPERAAPVRLGPPHLHTR